MHHHRTDDERDARAALHIPRPSQQHALCPGNDERNMHVLSKQKLCGHILALPDPTQCCASADAGPACILLSMLCTLARSCWAKTNQSTAWSAVSRHAIDAIDGPRSWYAVADDHRAYAHSSDDLARPFPATHHRGQTRLARLIAICIWQYPLARAIPPVQAMQGAERFSAKRHPPPHAHAWHRRTRPVDPLAL